ncbi:glutamate synthase subunit beta [Nakamurella endophytica]|uniref:Glutamate synthase [NADPH] small chain n=1 Tax=Nakamurella endophytica TaxID=1748367 RepID=A0A917SPA9_9ACTN|nr:glutamate synthase subunit beta [Nakamurella endophytica]GGL90851.1 glutamate synthase [NADPH] small chain [Nakamurella endophytica]
MADPTGFLKYERQGPARRPIPLRLRDWNEVYEPFSREDTSVQAARCMDCGIPFCHQGCPLGNLIPEWNELVRLGRWDEASERLHATNNFPEFTGRLCPAPCEGACVLGIADDPVSIKLVEQEIGDWAVENGGLTPRPAAVATGRKVAVVGSGPAGLAAAQQLARAGHEVTVFERDGRIGGLMRYGIPEFKMDRSVLDRRLDQMRAEGVRFLTHCTVGADVSVADLRRRFDAIVLATGATVGRELRVAGRTLAGVHLAMEYLVGANRALEDAAPGARPNFPIDAGGKHVVIIGGGDTGADCYGTALRQGAASVTQLDIHLQPPPTRDASTPWPTYPLLLRTSAAHEEGGQRVFGVNSTSFKGSGTGPDGGPTGHVTGIDLVEGRRVPGGFVPTPGTERHLEADLVLLALGFVGPERAGLLDELGVDVTGRGTVARDDDYMTNMPGVFVAGDAGRGQSLIVWAIAEGRSAAAGVDAYLSGATALPDPVEPSAVALR